MSTPLELETDRRDGAVAFVAVGELDLSNIEAFSEGLADALAEAEGDRVIVDLSAVEYLDSGAINALFTYADGIRVIANPILMPVLAVSGLTEVVRIEAAARPAD